MWKDYKEGAEKCETPPAVFLSFSDQWLCRQALDTKELEDVHLLVKPDAEKYFMERPGSSESAPKLPALAESE